MESQKIVRQLRLSGWGETVKERIASGETVERFCEEKGISKAAYYYRQKKVREAACAELVKGERHEEGLVPRGWAQLEESACLSAANNTLAIEVGGFHIIVSNETDMELLAKVCRALKTQC